MSQLFRGPGFTVLLPDGWEGLERAETCTFFRAEDGVGAVTVSVLSSPMGVHPTPAHVLSEMAGDAALPCSLIPVGSAAEWACGERRTKGVLWRYWVSTPDRTIVLVSYNCRAIYEGVEDDDVQEIVRTLRVDLA